MSGPCVLVVDDDAGLCEALEHGFAQDGFRVRLAGNAEDAWQALVANGIDVVLLDLLLPGRSGLDLLVQIRSEARTAALPVLILSGRDNEMDKLLCFERGADDYVTKPCSGRELIARVRALLRRSSEGRDTPTVHAGALRLLPGAREAFVDGRAIALTPREFDLLLVLARHPGRVLSRRELLATIWGAGFDGDPRTIDVHIRRLRRKLGSRTRLIETVTGSGYKLAAAGARTAEPVGS